MVAGKRQTAWPASTVSRASASGWQWRRRAQECAAGFSAGAHLSCRRGIKDLHTAGERAEAGRRCIGPRHPGARNGKRFVQGKAGPIVFRVGMFGYVRLPLCPIFLLVAGAPANASRSRPAHFRRQAAVDTWPPFLCCKIRGWTSRGVSTLHDTPCAFRYPFLEVRTYGLVRRGLLRQLADTHVQ